VRERQTLQFFENASLVRTKRLRTVLDTFVIALRSISGQASGSGNAISSFLPRFDWRPRDGEVEGESANIIF